MLSWVSFPDIQKKKIRYCFIENHSPLIQLICKENSNMESSYIVELYNKNMYNPRLSPKKSWAANSI